MTQIILLLAIPLARFLIYINDWHFFKTLMRKQLEYLGGLADDATEEKKKKSARAGDWIMSNLTELKRRVEKAGIQNPVKTFMEPKGYGYVGQTQLSILDNILYPNSDVQHSAQHIVRSAKGYYLNQALRSLSPIYWIEVIFFLPKKIVSASGLVITSKFAET